MAQTDHPIATVTINGWRERVVIAKDRRSYRMPLHDKHIGNDQRVHISYAP